MDSFYSCQGLESTGGVTSPQTNNSVTQTNNSTQNSGPILDGWPEANLLHVSQFPKVAWMCDYSWGTPSLPHINVTQISDKCVTQSQSSVISGTSCNDIDFQEFIQAVSKISRNMMPVIEWRYEWRRQAQQIIPFIYLGPSSVLRDIEFLRREKITMILIIRDNATAQAKLLDGSKVAKLLGIESKSIDVAGNSGLIAAFPEAIKAINDHIIGIYRDSKGSVVGKVLVSCESGNERSATVVTAYLMSTYDLEMISAIQLVQSQRFCVSFNDDIKHLLLSYSGILIAQRSVENGKTRSTHSCPPIEKRAKRRWSEISGQGGLGSDYRDIGMERPRHRADIAPF